MKKKSAPARTSRKPRQARKSAKTTRRHKPAATKRARRRPHAVSLSMAMDPSLSPGLREKFTKLGTRWAKLIHTAA